MLKVQKMVTEFHFSIFFLICHKDSEFSNDINNQNEMAAGAAASTVARTTSATSSTFMSTTTIGIGIASPVNPSVLSTDVIVQTPSSSSLEFPMESLESNVASNNDGNALLTILDIVDETFLLSPTLPGSPVSSIEPTINGQNGSSCVRCKLKDELLTEKDAQIKTLRDQLKKARKKIWYIEKTRKKLNSEFSVLKEKSILNEKICETLEVI